MKNILGFIGAAILIVVLFSLGIWWQIYRFHDCRKVGHSLTYCILTVGK